MTDRRVLLVDDDEALRSLLRMTLPTNGFEIAEAGDGAEALEHVSERLPHLVVLDWNMPERSGEEVLADLKRRHPHLPVIVLTADREPRERGIAESLGADEFLTKPFSPLQLLGVVERLLAERTANEPS